jgi:hypothetical protein
LCSERAFLWITRRGQVLVKIRCEADGATALRAIGARSRRPLDLSRRRRDAPNTPRLRVARSAWHARPSGTPILHLRHRGQHGIFDSYLYHFDDVFDKAALPIWPPLDSIWDDETAPGRRLPVVRPGGTQMSPRGVTSETAPTASGLRRGAPRGSNFLQRIQGRRSAARRPAPRGVDPSATTSTLSGRSPLGVVL